MAATLEELQAQRSALIAAIASGTYQVRDGEKMVTYQTADGMQRALATLNDEIAKLGSRGRRKTYLTVTRKGL